jgi:hypothetical protein
MNIPERPGGGAKVAQQQAAAKKVRIQIFYCQ